VNETCDVEGWEDGEDLAVRGGCNLSDLEALGNYILMGDHYLPLVSLPPSSANFKQKKWYSQL
jgi:hypothetical protein